MDTGDKRSPRRHNGPDGDESRSDHTPSERTAVGQRLRAARETLGLTQDDVAGALGIPRTSVIAMESGKRNVTAVELRRLARLYRRNVQWLLGEEDDAAAVDTALYRATQDLSDDDKAQVLRFAQFLAAAGPPPTTGRRRTAPPPFGTPPPDLTEN
ncbi:helix-turn-helix domain-containing protein [Pseudonocardia sp. DLS-67]